MLPYGFYKIFYDDSKMLLFRLEMLWRNMVIGEKYACCLYLCVMVLMLTLLCVSFFIVALLWIGDFCIGLILEVKVVGVPCKVIVEYAT